MRGRLEAILLVSIGPCFLLAACGAPSTHAGATATGESSTTAPSSSATTGGTVSTPSTTSDTTTTSTTHTTASKCATNTISIIGTRTGDYSGLATFSVTVANDGATQCELPNFDGQLTGRQVNPSTGNPTGPLVPVPLRFPSSAPDSYLLGGGKQATSGVISSAACSASTSGIAYVDLVLTEHAIGSYALPNHFTLVSCGRNSSHWIAGSTT